MLRVGHFHETRTHIGVGAQLAILRQPQVSGDSLMNFITRKQKISLYSNELRYCVDV
ncbi:Uncharacterised protein [Vibrio cholerae]|nr:Uncharacterised protein [Vibrio cholerae]